jgi:hypothetical protein
VPGDMLFAGGAVLLAIYALRLLRRTKAPRGEVAAGALPQY